jgi:hypothetical protein
LPQHSPNPTQPHDTMPDALVNFALRGTQIIFAAIVTGLSIDLARGHHWGGLPVILGYVCFVGCVSLLAGFAGLAASWITILQGKIGLLMDGFITIVNLAGGLVSLPRNGTNNKIIKLTNIIL